MSAAAPPSPKTPTPTSEADPSATTAALRLVAACFSQARMSSGPHGLAVLPLTSITYTHNAFGTPVPTAASPVIGTSMDVFGGCIRNVSPDTGSLIPTDRLAPLGRFVLLLAALAVPTADVVSATAPSTPSSLVDRFHIQIPSEVLSVVVRPMTNDSTAFGADNVPPHDRCPTIR